jgi:hypothetical protein
METEQLNSTFINKNSIKNLSEQELNKEEINKISNNHYDSVKLKYFRSLGVQAPIINKNQLQKKKQIIIFMVLLFQLLEL